MPLAILVRPLMMSAMEIIVDSTMKPYPGKAIDRRDSPIVNSPTMMRKALIRVGRDSSTAPIKSLDVPTNISAMLNIVIDKNIVNKGKRKTYAADIIEITPAMAFKTLLELFIISSGVVATFTILVKPITASANEKRNRIVS